MFLSIELISIRIVIANIGEMSLLSKTEISPPNLENKRF